MNDQLNSLLSEGLSELKVNVDSVQQEQLLNFVHLLNKWNKVYNLTAVRDPNDMVSKHLLDSLSLVSWLPQHSARDANKSAHMSADQSANNSAHKSANMHANSEARVYDLLDVGSGAGLPVLPLAIARPDLNFASVESNGKKTRFQQQACVELKLSNVDVVNCRIEEAELKAKTIVSRAFTAPDKFLRSIEPHCVAHAQIIIMLGLKERMPRTLPDGFQLQGVYEIDVPRVDSSRHVAICVKD